MSDIDTKIDQAVHEVLLAYQEGKFPVNGYLIREAAVGRAIWAAAVADTVERCAKVCEGELVDSEATGAQTDIAYNVACGHCAAAIRALTPPA